MMSRTGVDELADWRAYESVYGLLGGERLDVLAATIQAAVYNAQRSKNSDPVVRPVDLMPAWDRKPRQQSSEDMLATVKAMNAAFGGTVRQAEA